MSKKFDAIRNDTREYVKELKDLCPDTLKSFYAMSAAATKSGTVDEKTKEFIALAIGVAKQCDACIAFHIDTLKKLGATRDEVAEVLGVAVYMGGGPSLMYSADALRAFDQD